MSLSFAARTLRQAVTVTGLARCAGPSVRSCAVRFSQPAQRWASSERPHGEGGEADAADGETGEKKEVDADSTGDDAEVDPTAELQAQLAAKAGETAEWQDKYMRKAAEYENSKRRHDEELAKVKEFGIQKFAKELLNVADVLKMALDAAKAESEKIEEENPQVTNMLTGLDGTHKNLMKAFSNNGVEMVNPIDQEFDPHTMEALFETPDPEREAGTVSLVHRTGFLLHGRVLRPSQVGVVAKP